MKTFQITKNRSAAASIFILWIPAAIAGLLCLLTAVPVMAHPGSLWGIDIPSVIALRDQARVMAHAQDAEQNNLDHPLLHRVHTIVLDPGHGGDNSGATGIADIAEKHLTLELAYDLRERLQKRFPHLRVILTRYWDQSMDFADRVHLANIADADLFISLHYNAATHDRAVGYETYFLRPEDTTPGQEEVQGLPIATAGPGMTGVARPIEGLKTVGQYHDDLLLIQQDLLRAHQHTLSGRLAETVQERFRNRLDSIDRGVKQANFSVLRGAHMPAVVVEVGFLTHPEEGKEVLTSEHRETVSRALMEAVELFDHQLQKTLDDATDPAEEVEIPERADDPDKNYVS